MNGLIQFALCNPGGNIVQLFYRIADDPSYQEDDQEDSDNDYQYRYTDIIMVVRVISSLRTSDLDT